MTAKNASALQKITFSEACAFFSERLMKDQGKVIQSLALRAAQLKYVISCLTKHAQRVGDDDLAQGLEKYSPPMSEQKLLAYANTMHHEWTQKAVPLLQKKWGENPPEKICVWIQEAEDVLVDMRRITAQNLSKHPALKPHQLAESAAAEMNGLDEATHAKDAFETNLLAWKNELDAAERARDELVMRKGFDSFSRLEESFQHLTREKTARTNAWLNVWGDVQPCLEYLNEHSEKFSEMENAQMRILQWYLASPLNAIQRDVHGAGIVMLLRFAVEALLEMSDSKKTQTIRETLEKALEEESFVAYFEQMIQLDEAIRWNVRTYQEHELFPIKANWENKIIEAQKGIHVSSVEMSHWEAEENNRMASLEKLKRELNELCEKNWGVVITF